MEENWKLVTSKLYLDAEAEMTKMFCKGLGINLQIVDIEYPFLFRQGNLPLLIIGPKIFQKGEISKYLINLYYQKEQENVEQYFNIFDSCYNMLNIIDYFMWSVKSKLKYNYRDYYSFFDFFNKFHNIGFLVTKKQKFHKLQYKELDKLNQSKIHLTIIQHWIQLQHQENKPISIYYIFCYAILKSIIHNLRYSQMYNHIIKSELKNLLYQMNQKLNANFQLPNIEGIQNVVKLYNFQLDQRVKLDDNKIKSLNKHQLILQIITLSLFTYAICKNDFQ